MDLLDRYLQAIQWWLPGAQKEDIVTELREDLQSQIDEKRAALGREPNDGEVSEILKRCGRPMRVAGRYLPQQQLIGPSVYPMYRAVLKALAFLSVASWAVVGFGRVLLLRGYPAGGIGEAIAATLGGFWQFGLVTFAAVTLVFAAIDRAHTRTALESWNPRDLPRVRDTKRIPRLGSVIEMALSILFMTWWADVAAGFPVWTLGRSDFRWTPGPVWEDFHRRLYWPLLALAAVALAISAVNLLKPYWTRTRLAIRVAGDLVAAVLVSIVIAPHASAVRTEAAAVRMQRRATGDMPLSPFVDVLVFAILATSVLVCLCQAIYDLWRIMELRRTEAGAPASGADRGSAGDAPVS